MNAQQTRVRMEQPVWTTSTRQHVSVLRGGPAAPANQVGFFTKTLIWNSAGVLLVPGGVQINKNVEADTIGMKQTLVLLMLMIFFSRGNIGSRDSSFNEQFERFIHRFIQQTTV